MSQKIHISVAILSIIISMSTCVKKEDNTFYPLVSSDLRHFEQVNGTATYEVVDQVLIGTSVENSPNSFLALKDIYRDFILEFDVRIDVGLNSGVQVRSVHDINIKEGRVHGYQVEIETSDRKWSGGIYEEQGRGWLYPLTGNIPGQNAWINEGWNHYRIEAEGETIRTYINNIPCAHLTDRKRADGIIAFQVHSIDNEKLAGKKVRWKNIEVQTNNLSSQFSKDEPTIHMMDLTKMQ